MKVEEAFASAVCEQILAVSVSTLHTHTQVHTHSKNSEITWTYAAFPLKTCTHGRKTNPHQNKQNI